MRLPRTLAIIPFARSVLGQYQLEECKSDILDLKQNENLVIAKIDYFLQCAADSIQIEGAECNPSDYEEACDEASAYFLTYSAKLTCGDDPIKEMNNFPNCIPFSCAIDEDQLIQTLQEESNLEGLTDCTFVVKFGSTSENRFGEGFTSSASSLATFSHNFVSSSLVALLVSVGAALF